ncbi:hypothetical protein [Aliiglaciecola sp. LCG003]|uniref:hypothetical protein n=1 Tax=Aliiglaciecola sp. LCG003 TaxID=3053655 RepID=UPI00257251A6|nr:hypothetical protein [Aliiglaciecola sp. LCG003]WJG10290.1 hypothetical protein QR722_04445 [Aliiglaciecola sp. LCG003]
MLPIKKRYSALIMFSITMLLAIGISSAMYFFKIKKNEDYQNRLHFRELNEVSRSILQSAGQLSEIAKVCDSEAQPVDSSERDRLNGNSAALTQNELNKISCDVHLKNRVDLANRSANLKTLKISRAPQVSESKLEESSIYFDPGGKTYVAVKIKIEESNIYAGTLKPSRVSNILEMDTKDLIPANIERFPLVLITNGKGVVIGSRQINRKGVETADLQFQEVNSLFKQIAFQRAIQEGKKEYDKSYQPTTSEILNTQIGGVEYRVFLQPSNLSAYSTNTKKLYLVGLIPANQLKLAKLSISPNTAVWFVLILIGLIALLPLMKLRFVSVKYAFSRGDVSQIGLGLLVAIGISSIGINHQLFYGFLMDDKAKQAKQLHQQITAEFEQEIHALNTWGAGYAGKLTKRLDNGYSEACEPVRPIETVITNRAGSEGQFYSCVDSNLVVNRIDGDDLKNSNRDEHSAHKKSVENNEASDKARYIDNKFHYVIEGAFILDSSGRFANGSTTIWKERKLLVSQDIELSHRQYFQRARDCEVWGDIELGTKCKKGIVFERINNVRDGRKNTQFGVPLDDASFAENKNIFSFGTRLRTFFHRVMPEDFGYLVFDQNGSVVFHSDEQRSLIENVFVETDNNKQLHAFVANKGGYAGDKGQPIDFNAVYRGKSHLFAVGDLFIDEKYSNAPLTLVVFFDQSGASLNNMLLLFMALILFLLIIIPLFVYFRYATSQPFWASLLYYNPRHSQRYFGWLLLLVGASVFCLFMMGVVFDLTLRISIWLLTAALVFKLIMGGVDPNKTVLRGSVPSMKLIISLAAFLTVVCFSLGFMPAKAQFVNWLFLLIGLAAFGEAIITYLREPVLEPTSLNVFDKERYSKMYLGFMVAILFFVSAVPASLIINSANGYMLQHQARVQTQHLEKAKLKYQTELADYKSIVGESAKDGLIEQHWLSAGALRVMFPGFEDWITMNDTDNNTDAAIEAIFSNIEFADSLLAEITHLAKRDPGDGTNTGIGNDSQSAHLTVHYSPDKFMLRASAANTFFILFALLAQIFIIHRLVELMLVRRLFGDHLTNDFRISYPREQACKEQKWNKIVARLSQTEPLRLLLLHSTKQRILAEFDKRKCRVFEQTVINIKSILGQTDGKFDILSRLSKEAKDQPEGSSEPVILLLEGFEQLAFEKEVRRRAFNLTEILIKQSHLHVVISADTAPIFRLIKQDEYPNSDNAIISNSTEELGWAQLFCLFTKSYDWTPGRKYMPRAPDDVLHLIENEANGWAELREIEQSFKQYHRLIKLHDEQARITEENLKAVWKPSQIVAFFAMHAGALYRMKWELCTKNERFLLYQMASGANVNPLNAEVLEHLMRRGYIYRDAGWHIVNDSFKRFALHAEREESINEWQADANTGIWSMLRIPMFTIVLVLLVVTIFSSGQAIDSALGILTAVLGMIPLLLGNISLIKGGTTSFGQ